MVSLSNTSRVDESRNNKATMKNKHNISDWILSYPRSGNTFVRLLVANMLYPEIDCGHREIDYMVPDETGVNINVDKINTYDRGKVIVKSHDPYIYMHSDCKNVLYIYRDVRDVVVSCYHFRYWVDGYKSLGINIDKMSFDEFFDLFMDGDASFGPWVNHVRFWYFKAHRYMSNLLIIKYEDLLDNTFVLSKSIAKLFDIDVTDDIVHSAVEKTRYARQLKLAPAAGVAPKKLGLTGTSGGWKNVLSEEQVNRIQDGKMGDLLKDIGYTID